MKKQYTKRQIQEAIKYWQKQLKMMNERNDPGFTFAHWVEKDFSTYLIDYAIHFSKDINEFAESIIEECNNKFTDAQLIKKNAENIQFLTKKLIDEANKKLKEMGKLPF